MQCSEPAEEVVGRVRVRGDGGHLGNKALQTQQDQRPHELTETVAACTSQHWSSVDGVLELKGEVDTAPSTTQKLYSINNHLQMNKLVFSKALSLLKQITLQSRLHTPQ